MMTQEQRDQDRAMVAGIADAKAEKPRTIPRWIIERYGRYSEVAYFYSAGYNETVKK